VDLPDRKIPPMPTTTTHCYPNVALPTGVAAVDDWRPNDPLSYRVVLGAGRGVTGHNVVVQTSAIQFADGRIDDGGIVAPSVTISHACDNGRGLSTTQARELAAVLLEAADELDRWIEPFFNSGSGNIGMFSSGTNTLMEAQLNSLGIGNSGIGDIGFWNSANVTTGFGNSGVSDTGFDACSFNTVFGNSGNANTGFGVTTNNGATNSGFDNTGTFVSGFANSPTGGTMLNGEISGFGRELSVCIGQKPKRQIA
jgi:hypothetical protein